LVHNQIIGKEEQEILSYSYGAELIRNGKRFNSYEIVLSVPVGDTHEIVRKYLIHAHPDDEHYNYKRLKDLITFRQNHGGRMEAIHSIDSTFSLDHNNWVEELEKFQFTEEVKNRISDYITERKKVFVFEKPTPFKFYILTLIKELLHEPRLTTNNSVHRYYTFGELVKGDEFI
jgi:hypothetical protein